MKMRCRTIEICKKYTMKTTGLLLTALLFPAFASMSAQDTADPEIMNIAGKSIPKSEFEYIYHKNLRQQAEKTPLNEYVTLFCNYKLKVAEAEAQGLDTTKQFRDEYKGYCEQLVKPYLVDSGAEEQLAKEAYARLLEEVEASHILFEVPPTATTAEKKAIYEKAMSVREQALNGADFAELARRYSDDPSAKQNDGYLGYFTAFRMVYPFEKAAYETPVGEISLPVETRFGYHLIKVSGRRKTRAVQVAHIMLDISPDAPEKEQKDKEKKINALYAQLLKGADFAELVRANSEDTYTAESGGVLPFLEAGQFVKPFEDAAFALDSIGEISAPVRTQFGWHILKLIDEKTPNSYEQMRNAIVRYMARDERADAGRKQFFEQLKADKNFAWNETTVNELEKINGDSLWSEVQKMEQPLFVFAGTNYPASGLTKYLKADKTVALSDLRKAADAYTVDVMTEYETAELCKTNPEIKYLLQEYRDGMLLFEVSDREVWKKAPLDTKGLKKYFKKNKKQYTWNEPHYKGYVISSDSAELTKAVKERLGQKTSLTADNMIQNLYREYTDSVRHISLAYGVYAKGENPIVDYAAFGIGTSDSTAVSSGLKGICGKILAQPESYEDVKGFVTSDYQTYLEEAWVKKLRKKYPVTIRQEVLATVKSEE